MRSAALFLVLLLPLRAMNVVFILVDDLGYMDVGFNNPSSFYETPRLNGLAEKSVRFTAAYAACPVCSPTRSAILTGQYPARTRNTDYFGAPNGHPELGPDGAVTDASRLAHLKGRPVLPAPYLERLDPSHTTLAEALKANGYATMLAGKWHLGSKGSMPTDHGFDVNMGGTDKGGPYGGKRYFSPYGNPNLPDGPEGEHLPDRLATEVDKFITAHKEQPFFVYFPFYSVHTPLMGRKDLVEKYQQKKERLGLKPAFEPEPPRENRTVQEHAIYAAMVDAMDQAVGKVLDSLERNGVAEETMVVFTSDNGGLSTSEGSPTSNLPFRAGKGWTYEGGIRVPLLVRVPGVTGSGSTCDAPVISTDFYPTILEVCGMRSMPDQHKDGTSFADLLEDPKAAHQRAPLFWHYPHWGNQGGIPSAAVRDGDWKLIEFYWKKGMELYDLRNDPGERRNLAAEHPDRVRELKAKLDTFRADTKALMPAANPGAKELSRW